MKIVLSVLILFFSVSAFGQLREKRAVSLLAGLAVSDGSSGYHVEAAGGFQGDHFGLGVYTDFVGIPSREFSNWTILGMQMKFLAGNGSIKPYGLFDFGLFNFQTNNDDVNMRTASLDLGAGIDRSLRSGNGVLLDARWKWLVDYAGKRDAVKVFTLSLGYRF
jgi:hypothetical protein